VLVNSYIVSQLLGSSICKDSLLWLLLMQDEATWLLLKDHLLRDYLGLLLRRLLLIGLTMSWNHSCLNEMLLLLLVIDKRILLMNLLSRDDVSMLVHVLHDLRLLRRRLLTCDPLNHGLVLLLSITRDLLLVLLLMLLKDHGAILLLLRLP
jgi:hypothetical protein